MTITKEMYEYLYQAGKEVFDGDIPMSEAKEEGIRILEMSPASSAYYLQAVVGLLSGKSYTYTISNHALAHYLDNIRFDCPDKYPAAIEAAYAHYQKKKIEGVNLPGVLIIVKEHRNNL